MDEKILQFVQRRKAADAPAPDPRGYRLYQLSDGDFLVNRPLLDLILLHLVEASDDQRLALARELTVLAGLA